ncbi:hypothetical protein AB833_05800 [Chromatiales bacterium (ex Bugula neritina AB1)]|nr:hypothetical protein AB833_05800 [Chromatiales bacterium (ex Bugula neritina AB1)]
MLKIFAKTLITSLVYLCLAHSVYAVMLPDTTSINGVLALGETKTYEFNANPGDTISVQAVDTGFGDNDGIYPHLRLYNPDGSEIASTANASVASLVDIKLTKDGSNFPYKIQLVHNEIYGGHAIGTGSYTIHFAKAPGANEGGRLTSQSPKNGVLTLGDIDTYTFSANKGDTISLQAVDTGTGENGGISPYIHLYNPDGSRVSRTSDSSVASLLDVEMKHTGTYTVQLSHLFGYYGSADEFGPYTIHFAKAPGANEGGRLTSQSPKNGVLTLGDIDTYTFSANKGDTISLQAVDTGTGENGGISPYIHLYNPDGSRVSRTSDSSVASLFDIEMKHTGTYTVQLSHLFGYYGNADEFGPYRIEYNCFGICASQVPNPPTLIDPSTQINDHTPEYQWYSVSNATWYYLSVRNSQGPLHQKWYSAIEAGCGNGSGVCSITPSQSISGNASWRVFGRNSTGNGGWSDGMSFSAITAGPPDQATLISPKGTDNQRPTFVWNDVENANWYLLWIRDETGAQLRKWYRNHEANCDSTTCQVAPSVTFSGRVTWNVLTRNRAGNGPWSSTLKFDVADAGSVPGKATLISPKGPSSGSNPNYVWNEVSDATWYLLLVNDSTGRILRKWYKGSDHCVNGRCSVRPNVLVSGSGRWWIQTRNRNGNGSFSALSFTP